MVYTRCLDGDLVLRLRHGELTRAQKAGLRWNDADGKPVAVDVLEQQKGSFMGLGNERKTPEVARVSMYRLAMYRTKKQKSQSNPRPKKKSVWNLS